MGKPDTTSNITDRLRQALTSTKTGKQMYQVYDQPDRPLECIILKGLRGARYKGIQSKHDGLVRFLDKPVASYVLRFLPDGTVDVVSF